MNTTLLLSLGIAAGVIAVVFIFQKFAGDRALGNASKESQRLINDGKVQAQDILSKAHGEAQDIMAKSRLGMEDEIKTRRQAIADIEDRVLKKEKMINDKESKINDRDESLTQELERVKQLKKKEEDLVAELSDKLEKSAGFSKEEASKIILTNVEREVRTRAGKMIKETEDQAKKIASRRAKEIITDAIQRTTMDHVVDITTSTVDLPDDELKGRIIGREGRNIRSFESNTGVDVIIDDTPGAVVLSAFDPIRREIAKMTMEKLVTDGRINPSRIEESVAKSKEELDGIILERGENAADIIGLQFHPKIVELLGKLHYRTSYGQNMLQHAIEAGKIAANMANILGVNADLAKRGAVLHDIGKAIDFEQVGTHVDLGDEICRKYGESEEVINCINAHHEDEEPDTLEAIIVCVADALSSSRPGARRESVETYIKRLEKLEALANGFDGVSKAYAIQAGREVRVIVKPDEVDDPGAHKLAQDMASRIENELDYPGEVKVSIIRETRASSVAQ